MDLKNKLNIAPLIAALEAVNCPWAASLELQIDAHLAALNNGNLPPWIEALDNMPCINGCTVDVAEGVVAIRSAECSAESKARLLAQLEALKPWRKGPFNFFGIDLNSEWRGDLKWARLADKIAPLQGKTVLDVGCANGYFSWRMAAAGAKLVVGVDPGWLSMVQFIAIKRYIPALPVYALPFAMEAVPGQLAFFDSVFSMGVLYHRRSPLAHLSACFDALKPGGELVLETLVIEAKHGAVLVPENRYARMRNVWQLAKVAVLCDWLEQVGFTAIAVLDEANTALQEQRTTEWMPLESLAKCLDPKDLSKTVEGYPAPRRAVITAQKPI